MKKKTNIIAQFKQWILSIVSNNTLTDAEKIKKDENRFIFMVRVEIKTKQFLGSQDKYYWFAQTGRYNVFENKFYTDHRVEGSHNVSGFKNIIDFRKSIVSYV